jgi:hypothetical protein
VGFGATVDAGGVGGGTADVRGGTGRALQGGRCSSLGV